jgi:hypothetical protein
MKHLLLLIGLCGCSLLTPTAAKAIINMQILNLPGGVEIYGSGKADLTALLFVDDPIFTNYFGLNEVYVGPTGDNPVSRYSNLTQTAGSTLNSPGFLPDSGNGDFFGISSSDDSLILPQGYTSNSLLEGSSFFAGKTIAAIGGIEGYYRWEWGRGGDNADAFNLCIGSAAVDSGACDITRTPSTSVPAPLPVFGAAVALGYSRKLRKRITTSNAMSLQAERSEPFPSEAVQDSQ